MSDLSTAPATLSEGTVTATPEASGIPAATPEVQAGQAEAQRDNGAGQAAKAAPATDSFFDPSALPDELKPAYKQMQAAYTKKTQELAKHRNKIETYDAFMQDPVGNLQRMASQYGMHLTRAEAKQAIQQQEQSNEEWSPKTWEDVFAKAEERATQKIMQQFAPLMQNVQKMQANSIENQLNDIDGNWRMYEDEMKTNLRTHPTLVNDVAMLYRLSVPEEVYTSRAVQAALSKFESKAKSATVGSKSEASRSVPAARKVSNFDEAVQEAKRLLQEQGR